LDQTIARFPLFHNTKRSEEGSENNKIYFGQVQTITKAVKLVEVIGTLISQTTILGNAFFLQIAFTTI